MCGCGVSRFFFSSRRRHTRLQGDWSSDVCSSDLSRGFRPWRREAPAARRVPPTKSRRVMESWVIVWLETPSDKKSGQAGAQRSEERRVGEEGRSRWSPDHLKKKIK